MLAEPSRLEKINVVPAPKELKSLIEESFPPLPNS